MALEISFNSKYLNFAVNQAITRYNMTNLINKSEKAGGKISLLLDTPKIKSSKVIFLNFFKNDNPSSNPALYNYVFKYINIDNEEEFKDYTILVKKK